MKFRTSSFRRSITSLALGCTLLGLLACADLDQAQALRDQAAQIQARLDAQTNTLEQRLATTDPADPARADLEARLTSSRTALEAVSTAVHEVDRALERAKNPPSGGAVAGSVAAFFPEPWRTPIVLGGAALAFLWRARQLKAGLRSVARGLEVAMREDEEFRKRFQANSNTFRSVQTSTAQRVVDEIKNPGFLQLPI